MTTHINQANTGEWISDLHEVTVGIMSAKSIKFTLNETFLCDNKSVEGKQEATFQNGKISFRGHEYDSLTFTPTTDQATFTLEGVTIGKAFHWQQDLTLTFKGTLLISIEENKLCAINRVDIEVYLQSVISSEMSPHAGLQLLMAHAVISRSWLLAQIIKRRQNTTHNIPQDRFIETQEETCRWYNRENHNTFDVCADDHCQRYQGINQDIEHLAIKAVGMTRGEVLTHKQKICDTRFSKCCGGITEDYRYCWENQSIAYLTTVRDDAAKSPIPDLSKEENAAQWIQNPTDAFCNTHDHKILSEVLKDYDNQTKDFYRWQITYTQEEIIGLIKHNLGLDLGKIMRLEVIQRGTGGRISRLEIIGTKGRHIVGKELEIRKTLSKSHLYSAAFIIKYDEVIDQIPQKIHLIGAGWGHGVGLCQIGAAVMSREGYDYRSILAHYYPETKLKKIY